MTTISPPLEQSALKKYEIVNHLIAKLKYRRFLEISTPTTEFTFHNIISDHLEICHRYIYNCPGHHDDGGATSFRSAADTSSEMLRALSRPTMPGRPYDCIFVDPHHTYRSTAIDLAGAFALLEDGGAIVVHDCNPSAASLADPVFRKGAWCGLTYAAFIDFAFRSGVAYCTVDTDHGCGVILKRPSSVLNRSAMFERDRLALEWETCRHDDDARYQLFDRHRTTLLNLISPADFLRTEFRETEAPAKPAMSARPAPHLVLASSFTDKAGSSLADIVVTAP